MGKDIYILKISFDKTLKPSVKNFAYPHMNIRIWWGPYLGFRGSNAILVMITAIL